MTVDHHASPDPAGRSALTARELRQRAAALNRRAAALRAAAAELTREAMQLEARYRALEIELDATLAAAAREAGDPLTPRTWCRCVLALVRRWQAEGRDLRQLEALLRYLAALDPPADAFTALLEGYVAHLSPASADAAALLERSWRRWHEGGPRRLPFQETLRTLGALLDAAGARAAVLTVAPDGATQQTFRELDQRYFEPPELAEQIAARVALRGKRPPPVDRYEVLLRALGATLDREGDPAQPYELVVTPRTVVVTDGAGNHRIFTVEELAALEGAARILAPAGARRNGS
jgi:hypothetical protein